MNRSNAPRGATVGGRQSDEPAAMSLRCGCCQSRTRPRKWPGSVAGWLYVGRVTMAVVRQTRKTWPPGSSYFSGLPSWGNKPRSHLSAGSAPAASRASMFSRLPLI